MAVEFDLKITNSININAIKDEVIKIFYEKTNNNIINKLIILNNERNNKINDCILEEKDLSIYFEIDTEASVNLLSYYAGDPALPGEDGGYWICLSSGHLRTELSYLLLLFIVFTLAKTMNTYIIDDALLLGGNRIIHKDEILQKIDLYIKNHF